MCVCTYRSCTGSLKDGIAPRRALCPSLEEKQQAMADKRRAKAMGRARVGPWYCENPMGGPKSWEMVRVFRVLFVFPQQRKLMGSKSPE